MTRRAPGNLLIRSLIPEKLFQALPGKAKKYAYLRDVQGDVLGKWHASVKDGDWL
jgi:hypothetical protein